MKMQLLKAAWWPTSISLLALMPVTGLAKTKIAGDWRVGSTTIIQEGQNPETTAAMQSFYLHTTLSQKSAPTLHFSLRLVDEQQTKSCQPGLTQHLDRCDSLYLSQVFVSKSFGEHTLSLGRHELPRAGYETVDSRTLFTSLWHDKAPLSNFRESLRYSWRTISLVLANDVTTRYGDGGYFNDEHLQPTPLLRIAGFHDTLRLDCGVYDLNHSHFCHLAWRLDRPHFGLMTALGLDEKDVKSALQTRHSRRVAAYLRPYLRWLGHTFFLHYSQYRSEEERYWKVAGQWNLTLDEATDIFLLAQANDDGERKRLFNIGSVVSF